MRFTRLHLGNWRNFTHIDVELGQRVFIVGPNASGKSNLLDAFRFLRDIALPEGGLRAAVQHPLRRSVGDLRALSARRSPHVRIEIEADLSDGTHWLYALEFDEENALPVVRREVVAQGDCVLLDRPNDDDRADPARLTQTHLEQVSVNLPFRALAESLAETRYLHIVPHLVRDSSRAVTAGRDPHGSDFLEQLAQTPKRTRDARLARIEDAMAEAVPQLGKFELCRDSLGVPHLRAKYRHWRPHGKWQTEEHFSDGTLRLFGLLWALLDGNGPLLLEEPELSLHPAIAQRVPQMMARVGRKQKRQIIVSTHSPDLLDDPGIGGEEVLVLVPGAEGTQVSRASDSPTTAELLLTGQTVGQVVMPLVAPEGLGQLLLFGTQ